MNLDHAQRCADRLIDRLGEFCVKIIVAGSIRRRRHEVGDIDLVAIPQIKEEKDLFGNVVQIKNLVAEHVRVWCQSEGWTLDKAGQDYMVWVAKGIQVDLWFATESTFGTILLCRTGSARHNVWLCERAIARGGKWHPYSGLYMHGKVVASRTEEEIYEAVGLPFLHPDTARDEPDFRRYG